MTPIDEGVGTAGGPGRERRRDGDETRAALVSAAVQLFSIQGYDGVSLREVERQAGVNRGLVTHHFGTKDGLWRAAVDALMTDFHDVMARYGDLLSLVSPSERRRVLIKVYIHFVSEHPEFFRLMVLEGDSRSERTTWFVERYLRRLVDYFYRKTDSALPGSEIDRAIDHFSFTGAASMVFAAQAQCEQLFGVDPKDPEFIDRFADRIADISYHREVADGAEEPAAE